MFKSQSPCNLGVWDVIRKTSFQKWFLSLPKNLSWEVLFSILTKSLNFEFISSFNFCGYIIWFIDWNDRGWNKLTQWKTWQHLGARTQISQIHSIQLRVMWRISVLSLSPQLTLLIPLKFLVLFRSKLA
jgi:hypothetical protein